MKHETRAVTRSGLRRLLNRYKQLGIVKGGELCLHRDDALDLINQLENMGITILGADGWYYARPEHRERGWLSQDLSADLYVGDHALLGDDPVHGSASVVRQFLLDQLPERTEYVSLTLDVPS